MAAQRRTLDSQYAQKEGELKRLQDFARNIEQIKIELRDLNLQLEAALEYMPRQFNLSGLLRKLTMLAQNSGLQLFSFIPKATEDRAEGTFYSTLGIDFVLNGSFTQVLGFFDQVSRLKRIINAESVSLSLNNQNAPAQVAAQTRSGAVSLRAVAKVKTYRFSE